MDFQSKYEVYNVTKPNQTKPNQTKPNQTKPNQTKHKFLALGIGLLTFSSASAFAVDVSQTGVPLTVTQSQDIDNYIGSINSNTHVTKTGLNANGAAVTCVDILNQPSFNSSTKNAAIQLQASTQLAKLLPGPIVSDYTPTICPKGSVEMKLPARTDIVKAGSLRNFLSKYPGVSNLGVMPSINPSLNSFNHEYAVYYQSVNAIASQATLNLWDPATSFSDMSLSQLWVAGTGTVTQTAEVGYQVLPAKYGDYLPHLFIYYTADSYQSTGCYNLDCPAFVKTSNILNIGGVVASSTVFGTQFEGTVAFYRDPATGNWILYYVDSAGNYIQSGYYPAATYGQGQLSQHANLIEFGGEIATPAPATITSTDMGSGQFSSAGYGRAAYQRNAKYMGLNGTIYNVGAVQPIVTTPACYTLTPGSNPAWGSSFYFGGPGCL